MIGDIGAATYPRLSLLSKLLPLLAFAGTFALLSVTPNMAQELPRADNISRMEVKQLGELSAAITSSVGQDTLKLQPAAKARDCLELTRMANAFALGYSMLAEVAETLDGKPPAEAAPLKANVIQSRIVTFAARVRAEEWLSRVCVSFVPPPEHVGEPRYATPAKLQTTEFTKAVIEARQVAEANLALAVQAGLAKNCAATFSALESIQLLVPYLEKLAKDVATRPQALGPRASRRGLEVAKLQLVNAGNKLYREVGIGCNRAPAAAGEKPTPASPPPAEPPTPAAP